MIRRLKPIIISFICVFNIILTNAQTIKGKIVDGTGSGIAGVSLILKDTDYHTQTNASGIFRLFDLAPGKYELLSDDPDFKNVNYTFDYLGGDLQLSDIVTTPTTVSKSNSEIAIINGDDLQQITEDDDASFSSILTASRDPFDEAAAYNLSAGRFRARGYNNEDTHLYLNGMPVNDLDDGRVLFNSWGGLNDVMRSQTNILTLRNSDFAFGGIGGSSFIDLRASVQRVQTKAVYSLSNRSYQHRVMLTHSTGMKENGWAISASASRRWAQSGYIDGTHYDSYSYFLSVDRKLGKNQTLNAVFLGAPLRRGKSSAFTQEVYDLGGSNFYNPNWGFQNGEIRNSREDRIHQPIAMLRHDIEVGTKTKITTTLGYQFGKYGNTRLDWYKAANPAKDYYGNLPSEQVTPEAMDAVTAYFKESEANRQLNWDLFYEANRNRVETIPNANNSGQPFTGHLSSFVLQEQRFDNTKLSFNSYFNSYLNTDLTLTGGINYLKEKNHNFVVLDDLLGGEFYVNVDEFAETDYGASSDKVQNDLNNINQILKKGDIYDYNYNINTNQANAWAQLSKYGDKFDLFISGNLGDHSFYREGFNKNGKFPDNSFGKSDTYDYFIYGLKGGITYKIDGRNYLYGVAGYRTRAPFSRFAYLSPRTRDYTVDGLTTEKILSTEAGYVFKYTRFKGRITGFVTDFKDQIDNSSFYEDSNNSFVNFVLTGINKRHAGMEIGATATMSPRISFEAALALGQYYYTSRPKATITKDLDGTILGERNETVYIKNFFVPGSPQQAGSFGINYNSPHYWFANLNINYYAKNYIDINPVRRMASLIGNINPTENYELFHDVIDQEVLPSQYTLDLFAGKSWKPSRKYYIAANLSVGNILNNKTFKTGGYEQSRFDLQDVNRFPSKYYYAYGRNYSFNISVSF